MFSHFAVKKLKRLFVVRIIAPACFSVVIRAVVVKSSCYLCYFRFVSVDYVRHINLPSAKAIDPSGALLFRRN